MAKLNNTKSEKSIKNKSKVSVATYQKRMLKHANFLRKLPNKRFNMGETVVSGQHWNGLPKIQDSNGDNLCGSAACLAGWLPHVFPRLCKWELVELDFFGSSISVCPVGSRSSGDEWHSCAKVVQKIFGLSLKSSLLLTDPIAHWQTPKQAANILERLAKAADLSDANLFPILEIF